MGKRSDLRTFRRRRQRTGYALMVSLAVVVVGAVMFSSLSPVGANLAVLGASSSGAESAPVQRVEAPAVEQAPEAASEAVSEQAATQEPADQPVDGQQQAAGQEEAAKTEAAGGDQAGASGGGDKGAGATEQAQKEPQQAAGPPPIPKPATNDLWMDIPALGLNDNYIANSNAPAALDAGATKTVESAFPWQDGANTYISAHRLGYPGTASDYQFYDLPNLALGDRIYLYDENLTVYTYEVTGFLEVDPSETWVTGPQDGRDMISLMTCIENYGDYWTMGPNWFVRYVVQADRVSVDPA